MIFDILVVLKTDAVASCGGRVAGDGLAGGP